MKISSTAEDAFNRVLSWIERDLSSRMWDWPVALMTIALVQLSSARLSITEWVPSLDITQMISLIAVVLGIFLGYSLFSRMTVIRLAFIYGIFLIPMQLLTGTERTGEYFLDLKNMFFRLLYALDLFIQNQPIDDTLFFILLTSSGFWLVGVYAGYRAMKHRDFLDAALPPGLIILIVQIYDPWLPVRGWGLGIYIFLALALLGRVYFLDNKTSWKRRNVFLPSETEWEFSRSVIFTAAIAVLIAWVLPGTLTRMEAASRSWQDFIHPFTDRFSNAVSALDSPYGTSPGGDFYGSDLKLGSNAPVSDTPVFFVEVEDTDINVLRYYWRGRVYNQYEDGRWTNTDSLRRSFDPQDGDIRIADERERSEVAFTITMNFPKQELLYAPADMIWVNREGAMIVNTLSDEEREVTAWFADPSLTKGGRYEVRVLIAYPSVQDLQQAGTEYPVWVTDRYLQVPPEIQTELKQLAERITAPYTTPYDKAQAVTSYLRREIQYETKINEAPPDGMDPLLWVLFDLKKGFCIYYSSAEVLMLRTLGIPARMAVGFAQGIYDEEQNRYSVARLDSHAWPEVYFPRIGWVEFEPTAAQDRLIRPEEQVENPFDNERGAYSQNNPLGGVNGELENPLGNTSSLNEDGNVTDTSSVNRTQGYLVFGAVLILIVSGFFLARRSTWVERLPIYLLERFSRNGGRPPRLLLDWARWSGLLPIEKAFQAVNLSLMWLGHAQPSHTTPAERADILMKILPKAKGAISDLLREFQTALFTSRSADLTLARHASTRILLETWRVRIFRYRENLKQRYN